MSETLGNGPDIDPGADELGCREVPEIVQAHGRSTDGVPDTSEEVRDVVGAEGGRRLDERGEDEGIVGKRAARLLDMLLTHLPVLGEERHGNGVESDPPGTVGLGELLRRSSRDDDERARDLNDTVLKIDVGPPERAQLAPAHPSHGGKDQERGEARVTVLRGEGPSALPPEDLARALWRRGGLLGTSGKRCPRTKRRALFRLVPLAHDDGARRGRARGPRARPAHVPFDLSVDPVEAFVPVVVASAAQGVVVHVVLADSGYSYRIPEHFAYRLRAIGASLVVDLHPADRGTKGTYGGASLFNGNLYCPSTPAGLFRISPLSRGASKDEVAAHDRVAFELSRYKLGRLSRDDEDGYHRVGCPAVAGKCRCPLRPDSMSLSYDRPEILSSPPVETAPHCCVNQSITVPPQVNAKTRQRHDYLSLSHRRSYARRTAVERSNSMLKSPSGININMKGWCELSGVAPLSLFLACACAVVNFALVDAFGAREERADSRPPGQPVRRRRRRTIAELAARPPP